MRTERLVPTVEPGAGQDAQYCVLCETHMLFERVDSDDLPATEVAEWICISCGSAVFVDPPVQRTEEAG